MINIPIRVDALNPEEFEHFAADIAKIKYGNEEIQTFAPGKDGGIDATDNAKSPTIVIQAKRWNPRMQKSTAINNIQNEINKIDDTASSFGWINSFKYVVITSLEISPGRSKELIETAQNKGVDFELIDGSKLQNLARDSKYKKVFEEFELINKPLYQLFQKEELMNTIGIESQEFLNSFSLFNLRFFVETTPFFKAMSSLKENRMLVLHGNPGVGKSTMCAMLGNIMAKNLEAEVVVISRSVNEIQSVRDLYFKNFQNKDNALVVIFDDFLGQNSLIMEESQFRKIEELLTTVKLNENLYVIFNSRTQILTTATKSNNSFSNFIEDISSSNSKILIDSSELTLEDKGRIFRKIFESQYNKLIERGEKNAHDLSDKYKSLGGNFNEILEHSNFNPRLIEQIAKNYNHTSPNFTSLVLDTFKNPRYLYDEIFEKLAIEEKYLLFVILLNKNTYFDISSLRNVIECLPVRSDFSVDIAIEKLNGSWIKTSLISTENVPNKTQIDFANPSVRDYLETKIETVGNMKNEILKEAVYLDLLLGNINNEDFQKNIFTKWDGYLDRTKYIGERILSLIKYGNFKDYKTEISEHILKYNGGLNLSYPLKYVLSSHNGWSTILKEISVNKDLTLRDWFVNELLFVEESELLSNILHYESHHNALEESIQIYNLIEDLLYTSQHIHFSSELDGDNPEHVTVKDNFQTFCEWVEGGIQGLIDVTDSEDLQEIVDLKSLPEFHNYVEDSSLEDSVIEIIKEEIYEKLSKINLESIIDLDMLDFSYILEVIPQAINDIDRYQADQYDDWRDWNADRPIESENISEFVSQPLDIEM